MTTLARALVAMLLALPGVVLVSQSPAWACRCQADGGTREQVKNADTVFAGTVTEVSKRGGGRAFAYDVDASRAWKGKVEPEVVVTSPGGPTSCGLGELSVGKDYVFFVSGGGSGRGSGSAGRAEATTCGGSGPATATRLARLDDVAGLATPVRPPAPAEASRTVVEDSKPGSFTRLAAPGAAAALLGLLGLVGVRRLARR